MQTQTPKINYDDAYFTKKFRSLNDGRLKPEETTILTDVYSLMDMSIGNNDFYDKDYHDYYAIYTREAIHENYNIKESKIGSIFRRLVELGYLIRKRAKSGAMKLFTPFLHFNKKRKKKGKKQNSQDSKNQSRKKDSSSNDSDQQSSKQNKEQSFNQSKHNSNNNSSSNKKSSKNQKNDMRDNYLPKQGSQYETTNQLNNYRNSLLRKHVPEQAIKAAFNIYNDYQSLYGLFGTIFNAKNKALEEALKRPQDHFASLQVHGYHSLDLDDFSNGEKLIEDNIKEAFLFENNDQMTSSLAYNIRTILSGAKYKADNFNKYIFGAFKKYFFNVGEKYVNNFIMDMNTMSGSDIPIIRPRED